MFGFSSINPSVRPSISHSLLCHFLTHLTFCIVHLFVRKHNVAREDSFTLHTVNVQPATKEMINTTFLKPIFKVAGRHAHAAIDVWVNKTDPVCKPYSGASTSHTLLSLATMGLITMSTYFLY